MMTVVKIVVQVLLALTLAMVAYCFLDPARWVAVVPDVATGLSILAAAVLFRLGRGLPPFAVGEVSLDRVRTLTRAYEKVSTRLAVILGIALCALISLALARLGLAEREGQLDPWPVGRELMAASVFLSALAIVRGVALIAGDLDLVRLQSSLVAEDARLRRAREEKEKIGEAVQTRPFKNPESYGGLASFK